ncbi:putative holin [Pantoea agglomerans]|uniref:putative holin n=1 Tax=Enterobacter agglomerans TaxID=549 RepID=UPI00289CE378|nr:putative holin [Pantoea agglomerans]WNK65728.1 putative holin [Pantoea agglomerans]
MAEPLSTGATAAGYVAGWGIVTSALVGFITSVDYSIAFGAFAGSMCFIVTASDLTRRQIFGYFLFGYAAGVFGAGFVADKIEDYLDYREKPLDALAAVIISAAAVQGYFWLKNGGVSKLPFVKKWLGEKL